MMCASILRDVAAYYGDKLRQFGPVPAGVDWRDAWSQAVRFDQLLQLVTARNAKVIDIGCGYGALLPHMRSRGWQGEYVGLDIAPEMIATARTAHAADKAAAFEVGVGPSAPGDFAVASGIFNVRLHHAGPQWAAHVEQMLGVLDRAGRRGFAFNCLTAYSDPDRMREDLFYADPCVYFDLCMRLYGRQVGLLHDYGLFEFTLIVRKDAGSTS